MEQVVIVDAIRTPMGRSKGGAFRHVRAEDLSAHLMRSLLSRNPSLEASAIDDIYWGCVQQTSSRVLTSPVTRRCWRRSRIRYQQIRSTVCAVLPCRRCTMRPV